MKNFRLYSERLYQVAVVHGGPGAAGEMAPVARELASDRGILEPLQTARTLEGQVRELRTVLETQGDPPLTLIGFSWGAWLSFIVAARYPTLVKKLILVASGPFRQEYVARLKERRLSRLNEKEQAEFATLLETLGMPESEAKDAQLTRLGALVAKADEYDPVDVYEENEDQVKVQGDIFQRVWREASELRRSGELLALGRHIECPVVAIHGDYDPHPAEGVADPLSEVLSHFRFVLLPNCGHTPWRERQARERFYQVLEEEIA